MKACCLRSLVLLGLGVGLIILGAAVTYYGVNHALDTLMEVVIDVMQGS